MKLGAARNQYRTAWRMVTIEIADEEDTLSYRLESNKIRQKQFYKENDIPSSSFRITENKEDLKKFLDFLPAVHKLSSGGYDGSGVQVISGSKDLQSALVQPSILQTKVTNIQDILPIVASNTTVNCNLGGNDL
jgi:5-(carboxyamino)imidazole ribonucleotide synthase